MLSNYLSFHQRRVCVSSSCEYFAHCVCNHATCLRFLSSPNSLSVYEHEHETNECTAPLITPCSSLALFQFVNMQCQQVAAICNRNELAGQVTYQSGNLKKHLPFKLPFNLTDFLRPVKMNTEMFGAQWRDVKEEAKLQVCVSLK